MQTPCCASQDPVDLAGVFFLDLIQLIQLIIVSKLYDSSPYSVWEF